MTCDSRIVSVIFAIIITATLYSVNATSTECSCTAGESLDEALLSSSSVFEGIIIDEIDQSDANSVVHYTKFLVHQRWKGKPQVGSFFTIQSSNNRCDFDFGNSAKKYLVYTSSEQQSQDSFENVSVCSRTQPSSEVQVMSDMRVIANRGTSVEVGRTLVAKCGKGGGSKSSKSGKGSGGKGSNRRRVLKNDSNCEEVDDTPVDLQNDPDITLTIPPAISNDVGEFMSLARSQSLLATSSPGSRQRRREQEGSRNYINRPRQLRTPTI